MKYSVVTGAALVLLVTVSGCSAPQSRIDAAALLEERCGECHGTDIPKNARKSRSAWDESVTRMIAKGAKLSPQEKKALITYLSKRYKP